MTIDNNGNVGIGNPTPLYKLSVNAGDLEVHAPPFGVGGDHTNDGWAQSVYFTDSNNNYSLARVAAFRNTWDDQGDLAFLTHIGGTGGTTWQERMRIQYNGNV